MKEKSVLALEASVECTNTIDNILNRGTSLLLGPKHALPASVVQNNNSASVRSFDSCSESIFSFPL